MISAYLTPKDIAARYGCNVDKVLSWLKSGELRGIDVSQRRGGKPRWRVDPADLAQFEAARSNTPAPKPQRRRRSGEPPTNGAHDKQYV